MLQRNLLLLALTVLTGCNGFLVGLNTNRKCYSYSSLSATGHGNPQIIAKTTESFKLSDLYLMEAQIQATLLESDSLYSDNMHKYVSTLTMDPQTGSYLLEINSNKLIDAAYQQVGTGNIVHNVERPSCLNRLDWIGEVIASGTCGQTLIDQLEISENTTDLLDKIDDFTLDYLCMGYMREKDFSTSKTLTCRIAQSIPRRAVLDAKKAKTNLLLIETSDCIYLTKNYILSSKMEQGSDVFNVAKRWPGRPFQYSSAINPIVAEITMSLLGDLSKDKSRMILFNPTVGSGTFEAFALERGMSVTGFDINDKCVNGTIKNLQYMYGEDFTNKYIDIRVNDSTRLDKNLELNCNCAVTNLPWGQNTAIENENDNIKILTYLFNNLSEASYCAVISKYEVDVVLQSIGFTLISTASIPQTGFQLPQVELILFTIVLAILELKITSKSNTYQINIYKMKLSNALLLSSVVGVAVGQQTAKIKIKLGKTCVGEPDVFPKLKKETKGQCKKKCMKKAGCKGIRFENIPKDGGPKCGHYMENDVKLTRALPSDDPKYKVWCGKKQLLTEAVTPSPTSSSAPTSMPTEEGKIYNFQEGYTCGDKAKQKLKDTESRLVCKKACDDWDECFAFEWIGEDSFCGLYKNGMKTDKIKYTGEDNRVCALVVDKTDSPSSLATHAPSQSLSPSASPSFLPSTEPSSGPSDAPSSIPTLTPSSVPSDIPSDQPSSIPSGSPSFLPSTGPSSGPSDVPSSIPSLAHSSSPSALPSSQPSKLPTLKPTIEVAARAAECTLDLKLAYPHGEGYYDDDGLLPGLTDEAPYYGVHKDYMTVTDGTETCEGEDRQTPSWCTYNHTWEAYDEEDGFDPKDYYGAQHYYATQSQMYYATAEYMTIEDAAGKSFTVNVYHAFEAANYYYAEDHPYYSGQYYDHLMAAHLSIEVEGKEIATGLHHDHAYYDDLTDDDETLWSVNTHDENGEINPDYDDHFEVTVSCDNSCSCKAEYST